MAAARKPVSHGRGRIDATQFGANCPQGASPWGTPSTTEDCLFLNVYAPAGIDPDRWREGKGELPVMVWIHGGGFTAGAGSFYDPTPMVTAGNIIVVTINYRLGALGLFAQTALDAEHHLIGNYALMDQQLAFKWVRRNIRAFGGNPDDVTISGESAGGISNYAHLTSPLAAGLFSHVIIESGAPDYITLQVAESSGNTLAAAVGCTTGSDQQVAACLRAVPASQLVANQATPTGAIVDGQLVPEPPAAALAAGEFNRVSVLNGTNHDEGRLIAAFFYDLSGGPLEASGYASALATIGGFLPGTGYPNSDIPAIMNEYPLSAYSSPDPRRGPGHNGRDDRGILPPRSRWTS